MVIPMVIMIGFLYLIIIFFIFYYPWFKFFLFKIVCLLTAFGTINIGFYDIDKALKFIYGIFIQAIANGIA